MALLTGVVSGAIAATLTYVLAFDDRNDLDDFFLLTGIVVVVAVVVGTGAYFLTAPEQTD